MDGEGSTYSNYSKRERSKRPRGCGLYLRKPPQAQYLQTIPLIAVLPLLLVSKKRGGIPPRAFAGIAVISGTEF